jgi:coenzyme F420-0:L-glutamate ligase/coenzyme F420-1:gamma-L-glutamate ligase
VAGLVAVKDYSGRQDPYGYELRVTQVAVADELAAAAELVTGKLERVPATLIRGYHFEPGCGTGRDLVRNPDRDLFR